jgi:hypothetical protein
MLWELVIIWLEGASALPNINRDIEDLQQSFQFTCREKTKQSLWKLEDSLTIEFGCALQIQPSDYISESNWENVVCNIMTDAQFLGTRVSTAKSLLTFRDGQIQMSFGLIPFIHSRIVEIAIFLDNEAPLVDLDQVFPSTHFSAMNDVSPLSYPITVIDMNPVEVTPDSQCSLSIWRPHPSCILSGKGFSSDEIGDGPEPLVRVSAKTLDNWARKVVNSGEERRRGLPPLIPLYKNCMAKGINTDGMVARGMDSLVKINISLDAVGLINTEISNACVSASDAVDAILAQLPLMAITLCLPDRQCSDCLKADVGFLLDAMEIAGMGPYNLSSDGLREALSLMQAYHDHDDGDEEVRVLTRAIEAFASGGEVGDDRLVPGQTRRIVAACGIDALFLSVSDGRVIGSTLQMNKIVRHGEALSAREFRYLAATCKVALVSSEGSWYTFAIRDILPSFERSLTVLRDMLLDGYRMLSNGGSSLRPFALDYSRSVVDDVIETIQKVRLERGEITSDQVSHLVSHMVDTKHWATVTRSISPLEIASVIDSPFHPVGILIACWKSPRTINQFLHAQKVDLPENWLALTALVGTLESAVPPINVPLRRKIGLNVLRKIVAAGKIEMFSGRRIIGFGIHEALECLKVLFEVQEWSSLGDSWAIDARLAPIERNPEKVMRKRSAILDVTIFRDLVIPLIPFSMDIYEDARDEMISRLTERLTQVKDDVCPGTLLFGSDSSAIPIEQLFRTGSLLSSLVRGGSVDFRPCHPLNPYLFEISLSNPDENVITRYGRESRPTRLTRCEPPAGKHYTMPSDPLASSYMYFAEDSGNGITAYALREIPESVCLGIYSGGENTSPRMVKAPHYASTYSWDDGGDVKTGAEPEFSLDARFPGSCAVRLINDCLESSGETTTIALGWDPSLKRLEASKTLHTGRILVTRSSRRAMVLFSGARRFIDLM